MQRISQIIKNRIANEQDDSYWANDLDADEQRFPHYKNKNASDPNWHDNDYWTMKWACKYGNDDMPPRKTRPVCKL